VPISNAGDSLVAEVSRELAAPPPTDTEIRPQSQEEALMQIQVETDSHIQGSEAMIAQVTASLEGGLSRFSTITNLSVHLRDENSDKQGGIDDIRCMIEAEIESRRQPIAVTAHAATWEQAVSGAIGKLTSSLDSTLGRQRAQERTRTDPPRN
jgi:ribosome-associated translation inhibitor RaiA